MSRRASDQSVPTFTWDLPTYTEYEREVESRYGTYEEYEMEMRVRHRWPVAQPDADPSSHVVITVNPNEPVLVVEQRIPEGGRYAESLADSEAQDGSEDGDADPAQEAKKAALRSHNRFHGTRKCWAKYCWADRKNPARHSHPLETLSSNRIKTIGKDVDLLVIPSGPTHTVIRFVRYNGERIGRALNFYGPIYRRIEGYYGSGVAGYVGLINRLLLLSLFSFVLLFGLLILPSIINYEQFQTKIKEISATKPGSSPLGIEKQILYSFASSSAFGLVGNLTIDTYEPYLTKHHAIALANKNTNSSRASQLATAALELLEGTGWMEASWMFLGQYVDQLDLASRAVLPDLDLSTVGPSPYNLSMAFLFSMFAVLTVSVIVLIFSSGSSLKENLKGQHSQAYPFCEAMFSTWPHSLQYENGVENQRMTETSQLRSFLTIAKKRAAERMRKTTRQKLTVFFIRFTVWFLVVAFLDVFGYLLYTSYDEWVPENLERIAKKAQTETEQTGSTSSLLEAERFVFNFLPSIIITGFNTILPIFLNFASKFERYRSTKTELRVTLVRTILLRLASVAFLLMSFFRQLEPKQFTVPPYNEAIFTVANVTTTPCFETYVGQQIYKVLVLDVLVAVGLFAGVRVPLKILHNVTGIEVLSFEFDLSGNILSAIYIQCLYWLGIFFSPPLAGMAVLHFLVVAIVAQLGIFFVFSPSTKIHHSSGSDVFFTVVALFAFFLALLVLGFAAVKVQPSTVCGPFLFMADYPTMYAYFMATFKTYLASAGFLVDVAASSVVLFPVTVCLAVILYYKIATARAKADGIKILKQKIETATAQKKFLEQKARQLKKFS
ncbi:putative Transmembrane channel-like protein 7 [Hypsibius exemplaris]|uniref:Transmembrane channel-like protein 7 n=1 Tax=Hypsibius exemplaris TaxID=2072580 RepID=A0A1W0X0I3_HYPEX|nr:putative Transmembrane channel-like protein 7 [Hypsibius exemplaris]